MAEEFCKLSGFASRHLPRVFSRPNRKHSLDHAFPHESPERLRIRLENCLHHLTVSPRGSPIQHRHQRSFNRARITTIIHTWVRDNFALHVRGRPRWTLTVENFLRHASAFSPWKDKRQENKSPQRVNFLRVKILSLPTVEASSCIHHQPHNSPLEERAAATLPSRETPSKPAPSREDRSRQERNPRSAPRPQRFQACKSNHMVSDPRGSRRSHTPWNARVSSHPRQLRRLGKGDESAQAAFTFSLLQAEGWQQPVTCATQEAPHGQLCLSSHEKRRQQSKLNGSQPSETSNPM